ncbi:MAG TPA: poly-beta-1,6-N-acetyl-D-glucosamine N-deacetylase PgaB [Steroidobacteraceae bacterium]|nr:poly-beta-1,6-N-acetyl-D-glucosamine N-deacetylase PgaB [Steroidobacteraceae bacterium]
MALLRLSTCLWCWALFATPLHVHAADDFISLSYHEVESDDAPQLARTAIRVSDLAAQFAWLHANGYQPVSVQQILDARAGGVALPVKAVLLTFDDGKRDVHTRVLPLLRLLRYPAVVALVGSWLEVAPGGTVDYDGVPRSRGEFLSWAEVRDLQRSGLVEIASHSYDLHRGVPANPQGSTQPAATTRIRAPGGYESDDAYLARLRDDLRRNRDLIVQHTGRAPRVMVWPYGRSNLAAQQVAVELGMPVGLSLEDGVNTPDVPTMSLRRQLIDGNPSLQDFADLVRQRWLPNPWRSVRIEPVLWSNPAQQLSAALDQVLRWSTNISFVDVRGLAAGQERSPFTESLNYVAWQLERRAGSSVFIEVPANWLREPDLLADLARHVNFAGLRLATVPGDPVVAHVLAAVERWRQPVRLAFAPGGAPGPDDWRRLRAQDLVVLPALREMVESVPEFARHQALFEFPAAPGDAKRVGREMRRLEAAGNRNFGLGYLPAGADVVWPALSLRTARQLP